ncbi:MAG: flagellar biosynthesis anti-sigma factor FlgM [bacterium]
MAIEISNITPVAGEIPQNKGGKKKEAGSSTAGQNISDEVSISGDASFIGNLKSAIDSAQSMPPEKLNSVKQQVASGNYAVSANIAEGLIKNLGITGGDA